MFGHFTTLCMKGLTWQALKRFEFLNFAALIKKEIFRDKTRPIGTPHFYLNFLFEIIRAGN